MCFDWCRGKFLCVVKKSTAFKKRKTAVAERDRFLFSFLCEKNTVCARNGLHPFMLRQIRVLMTSSDSRHIIAPVGCLLRCDSKGVFPELTCCRLLLLDRRRSQSLPDKSNYVHTNATHHTHLLYLLGKRDEETELGGRRRRT